MQTPSPAKHLTRTWSVYILECSDGTFYTGCSVDVEARLKKHNKGKGAKYTKRRTPCTLVYRVEAGTVGEALKLEHKIKQLTRQQKKKLIEGDVRSTYTNG